MNFSQSQLDIFQEVKTGKGNLAVQASPGAGKSFVIINSLSYIPRLKKTIFLSFSNAIVNELKPKIPSHIKASTLHSLGCRMIMAKYKDVTVDENKYFKLALKSVSKKHRNKETFRKCYTIKDICNYARLTLTPFTEDDLRVVM
jgi:superfamily I DNA/RNA helicase